MMDKFRKEPPASIGGSRLAEIRDYQSGRKTIARTGATEKLDFPKSDVLQYYTEGGTEVSVRPSGTEPKIKFYIAVKGTLEKPADFDRVNDGLDAQIKSIYDEFAGSK
jgi:phosphoglucomutase